MEKNKRIILYGCGANGRKAFEYYGSSRVYCFCDNCKNNHNYKGKKIISYDELREIHEQYNVVVSVTNQEARREIVGQLNKDGIAYTLFSDVIKEEYEKGVKNAFSTIYRCHFWGGEDTFYSGTGSRMNEIIEPYIDYLNQFINLNNIKSICDIGCGDFYIMNQIMEKNASLDYCGIDVVEELIDYNIMKFGKQNVRFECMDVSADNVKLPSADLLIIRQVLQHLDNERINKILSKIGIYKYILITEHVYEGTDVKYNLDKASDAGIRLDKKSGVYIEKEPFNIQHTVHVLKAYEGEGAIRTSLIIQ